MCTCVRTATTHAHARTRARAHTHTQTHTRMHAPQLRTALTHHDTHTRARMQTHCTHTHALDTRVFAHARARARSRARLFSLHRSCAAVFVCVCMRARAYVCVRACVRARVRVMSRALACCACACVCERTLNPTASKRAAQLLCSSHPRLPSRRRSPDRRCEPLSLPRSDAAWIGAANRRLDEGLPVLSGWAAAGSISPPPSRLSLWIGLLLAFLPSSTE